MKSRAMQLVSVKDIRFTGKHIVSEGVLAGDMIFMMKIQSIEEEIWIHERHVKDIKGRLPSQTGEVAIPRWIAERYGMYYQEIKDEQRQV